MINSKILHIFPYIFIAVIFSNISYMLGQYSSKEFSHNLIFSLPEIFGLQMLGFPIFAATGVSWYLSALFFCSFLVFPMFCWRRELFTKYIAPITALIILGYIANTKGDYNNPGEWMGSVYKGMLRGYVDIALGCVVFELRLYLDEREKYNPVLLAILEIGGYIGTLCYACFRSADIHDFFMIPVLLFAISISFSNKSVLKRVFNHSVFNWLGQFSISIFLNHFYVMVNLPRLFPEYNNQKLMISYIVTVAILSTINYNLGKRLSMVITSGKRVLMIVLIVASLAGAIPIVEYVFS